MRVVVARDEVRVNGEPVEPGAEIDLEAGAAAHGIADGIFTPIPRAELKARLVEATEAGDLAEVHALETDPGLAPRRRKAK